MRIRKRTPARAADPGPAPALSASPTRPPPPHHHTNEISHDDEEAEEKRVILVATGVRVQEEEGDRVPAAAASNDSSAVDDDDDVPKPPPLDAAAARCSRNDGKRWRCKRAAVSGYPFCDRHIAWSSRKRKPRPRKHKQQPQHGSGGLGSLTAKDDAASAEDDTTEPGHDGGFQKRAKGGETGPAAA